MLHDNFVMGERLGIGATAEVFAATSRATGEQRALKVFTPLVLSDPETVKRIETEVAVLQSLAHANIVRLYGSHSEAEELALELEFVDGGDLRAWRKGYDLRLQEPILWILCQIARGIGCAHENGVLHRDLKPENVLISRNGDVKLSDFGLARQLDAVTMTKSGLMAGSIGYMAPEMLDGERSSPASDVFSFGAVAYELLTGVNPFAGPNPQSMMKKLMAGEFRPLGELVPGLPPRVEALVHSCLAIRPAQRPASIWHVEAELMSALSASPVHRLCRQLVSTQGRAAALEPAFREKLRGLEERRAAAPAKAEAIQLAREWSYLFPDAAAPAEILAALPVAETRPTWQRAAALLLLLLFVGSGAWLFRLATRGAPAPAATPVALSVPAVPAPPVTAPPLEVRDEVTARAASPSPVPKAPKRSAAAARERDAQGFLRVEADDDVRLLVDGEEIPRGQWSHIPVDPGRRHIRLVKDGYLPIENVISVQAGKLSVVRAKGGG